MSWRLGWQILLEKGVWMTISRRGEGWQEGGWDPISWIDFGWGDFLWEENLRLIIEIEEEKMKKKWKHVKIIKKSLCISKLFIDLAFFCTFRLLKDMRRSPKDFFIDCALLFLLFTMELSWQVDVGCRKNWTSGNMLYSTHCEKFFI